MQFNDYFYFCSKCKYIICRGHSAFCYFAVLHRRQYVFAKFEKILFIPNTLNSIYIILLGAHRVRDRERERVSERVI